jgi:glycosyltransferase involved in cell wall biosynthesis
MNQPLLHVMIPVYGDSPYLEETLKLVSRNLPDKFPITVIEDKSSYEGIEKIVRKFPRVGYIQNPVRLGIARNFQKCAEVSSGIFTQIIGSDDNYLSLDIETELRKFHELTIDVFIFKASVLSGKKSIIDFVKTLISKTIKVDKIIKNKKLLCSLAVGDWTYFPAIIWRTQNLLKFPFNQKMESAMDLDLKINLINAESKFIYINNHIIKYRRHFESQSSQSAVRGTRFEEEIECSKKIKMVATQRNWKYIEMISALSPSVRFHILFTLIKELKKLKVRKDLLKLFLSRI